MSDVFREEQRTARKAHRCGECGTAIKPGTVYNAQGGIVDGQPWDQKLCLPCAALVKWAWNQWPSILESEGRELGGLLSDLTGYNIVLDNAGELDIDPDYADELEIDPERNFPRLILSPTP